MNSFRFLERGIEAEIERQSALARRGGEDRAGDAPLRPAVGQPHLAALQGGGARLPLLPRARPRADRADRARCSSAPARRCPSCRPRAPSGSSASSALPAETGQAAGLPRRAGRLLRGGARGRRRRATRASLANWVTNELAARIGDDGPGRLPSSSPPRSRGWSRWWRRRRWRSRAAQGGARRAGGRGRRPGRDRRVQAASAAPATDELGAIVERAMAENADAVEKIRAGNDKAIGADRGRGDARDQGPRRRRRGPADDPRAPRRLAALDPLRACARVCPCRCSGSR